MEQVNQVDSAISALGLGDVPRITVCTAQSMLNQHVPWFPPDVPALITAVSTAQQAANVEAVLRQTYPARHGLLLASVEGAGRREIPLEDLGNISGFGPSTCLYVPPLGAGSSLEALQELVAHLRAPDGCPWDREQTHASLRRHLLEESYEVLEAIDSGSMASMCEEFGDLLLQIMLNSQVSSEMAAFNMSDVSRGIYDKIVRRHPHVFGELKISDVEGVLANWERLKEGERSGRGEGKGLLEGVPLTLPALNQAQEYQERAARVGFDWKEFQGVLDKIAEEVREIAGANGPAALQAEIGDLLFALVNAARWKGVDAESALRGANSRFRQRFGLMEAEARRANRKLSDLSLDEMELLWKRAKSIVS